MTAATKDDFIGTWVLVSCEHRLDDGSKTYPLGPRTKGLLVYTAEGYMTGALMDPDRKSFKKGDLFGGTDEEKAMAATGYVHYAGKFEVEPTRVLHHVEISLFPNWVGSIQQRFYRFYDGDKLDLHTNVFVSQGVRQSAHLIWRRAVPQVPLARS